MLRFTLPILTLHGERREQDNPNWLFSQYVKKWIDLIRVTNEDINFAEAMISYRPKECLGFE